MVTAILSLRSLLRKKSWMFCAGLVSICRSLLGLRFYHTAWAQVFSTGAMPPVCLHPERSEGALPPTSLQGCHPESRLPGRRTLRLTLFVILREARPTCRASAVEGSGFLHFAFCILHFL